MQDHNIKADLKKEERFYDLIKYLASTSLTLLGVLLALKQAKWININEVALQFNVALTILVLVFTVLLSLGVYLTYNGLSRLVQVSTILCGCFVISVVANIVLTLAKVT